ncbi:MAG: tellurite resistance/C4-dicarboxylate transporter family protein, partial [Canibacter sp.]
GESDGKAVNKPMREKRRVDTRDEAQAALSVRVLTPGYFAFVMATGIVSVGAHLRNYETLATILLTLAIIGYVVLIVLNVWRFVSHRTAMATDFTNPLRAFGFFTFVAATNVIAAALVGNGQVLIACVLLVVSLPVWIVLGYAIPWVAVLRNEHRPMLDRAHGSWFIWAVASQSVAVVAADLQPFVPSMNSALAIIAVISWSVGLFLYGLCGICVMLRLMMYPLNPEDFDPTYWVAMGALAISVVAGARIVEMDAAPVIDATRGVIAGTSVILWAFAAWLIPALLAVGIWRHFFRSVPLSYESSLWSMVFPFGMIAVAGMYLDRAVDLPIVGYFGEAWFWVALLAWTLTAAAMVMNVAGRVKALTTTVRTQ